MLSSRFNFKSRLLGIENHKKCQKAKKGATHSGVTRGKLGPFQGRHKGKLGRHKGSAAGQSLFEYNSLSSGFNELVIPTCSSDRPSVRPTVHTIESHPTDRPSNLTEMPKKYYDFIVYLSFSSSAISTAIRGRGRPRVFPKGQPVFWGLS